MSEYQYYEFTAVDKPLNEKEMQSLRNISSRAQITPTSFVNEYHWGDFKGNPLKLVKKHFDAFLKKENAGLLKKKPERRQGKKEKERLPEKNI